jgi:hypothetical protein
MTIVKLARLGGYLARAGDPPPGNKVIWRGLCRLTDIQIGFDAAKDVGNSPCPAGTSEDEKGPLDCNIPVYDIEGTNREGRSIVVAITPLGNLV